VAVTGHAFLDAIRPVVPRAPRTKKGRLRTAIEISSRRLDDERACNAARQWLLSDTVDFPEVCTLADLNPDAVREHAQRLADAGWPPVTGVKPC
jgi:hypothetical protein